MKKLLTSLFLVLVAIFLVCDVGTVWAWTCTTPLGIKIKASQKTISQYEQYWGLKWIDLQLDKIDEIFLSYQDVYQAYCLNPCRLTITIKPFDLTCVGEFPGDIEMRTSYGCIDGLYRSANSIWIHLGEDSGQGANAFCKTALGHELQHYFLKKTRNPCWAKEDLEGCKQFDAIPPFLCGN